MGYGSGLISWVEDVNTRCKLFVGLVVLVLLVWPLFQTGSSPRCRDHDVDFEGELDVLTSVSNFTFKCQTSDAWLLLAILGTLQWHVFKTDERIRTARTWGRCTIIMRLYKMDWDGKCTTASCAMFAFGFIVLDSCVVYKICERLSTYRSGQGEARRQQLLDSHDPDRVPLFAINKYMNVTIRLSEVVLVFCGQFGLLFVWMIEVVHSMAHGRRGDHEDAGSKECHISMLKWFISVVVVDVAGDEDLGKEFDYRFWDRIWHQLGWCGQGDPVVGGNIVGTIVGVIQIPLPCKFHMWFRYILDRFMNSFCRSMILIMSPIMLCVESPLDFVKDVVAVFFILEIDDLQERMDLTDRNGGAWKPYDDAEVVKRNYDVDSIRDGLCGRTACHGA